MKDAILISGKEGDLPAAVGRQLGEEGYDLHWTDDPATGLALVKGPESLMILEAGLQRQKMQVCNRLIERCRHRHVPCLVFAAAGGKVDGRDTTEFPYGLIRDTANLNEWREKTVLYRKICWQAREMKMMQIRLNNRAQEEEDDLRSAALIQRSLLPKRLPEVGGLRFAWQFEPFEKVGGDLFNVLQADEETVMAFLVDVSGHGISSAMVTVSVNQSLSLHTGQLVKSFFTEPPYYRLQSPAEVMAELAAEYPYERFDKFFTIVYLLMNIRTGELRYSCAGHPYPLLLRRDGGIEWLMTGGGLIGLPGTGPYEEGRTVIESGDRLFLYSDGLTDYCNYAGEHFGRRRLVDALANDDASLHQACGSILDEMKRFGESRPLQDDVTLLGMEFLGI